MIDYIGKSLLIEENKKKIAVIGDLHLGYDEALRASGAFIPTKMFEEMIEELNRIFEKIGKVDEVILLGDIKHDFGRISRQEWSEVTKLLDYLKEWCKKITIIKGNHDVLIEPIAEKGEVRVKEIYAVGRFCFVHGDQDFKEIWQDKIEYVIMGHGHPAVKLKEGAKVEKYKCFLEGKYNGKNIIILPSFSEYSIGSDPRDSDVIMAWDFPFERFNVRVVGENLEVLDFGKLGKLEN
jgi:uncharacterized protein